VKHPDRLAVASSASLVIWRVKKAPENTDVTYPSRVKSIEEAKGDRCATGHILLSPNPDL
jgi:hypothetical protein